MLRKKILYAAILCVLLVCSVAGIKIYSQQENSPLSSTQAKTECVFDDVKETDWFHEDVQYVYNSNLMSGTYDNLFAPDMSSTRGMIVTILWRLEGAPVEIGKEFADVNNDKYYYNAVMWASNHDIVSGFDDKRFGPEDNTTREQLLAIIYRYAEYKKYDTTSKETIEKFADKNMVSNYAVGAFEWGCTKQIISGVSDKILAPKDEVKRCQVAAILKRFCLQFVDTDDKSKENTNEVTETEAPNVKNSDNDSQKKESGIIESDNSAKSDYPMISIDNVTANPEDEIKVNVVLKNNPGILGMALTAYYDENNLELQDVENGEAFKNILDLTSSKETKSGIRFLWDGIELSQNDIKYGTILIMKFKVNKNAQSGKYPITLKCSDGDIVNADLDNVFLQIENGYITVENNN